MRRIFDALLRLLDAGESAVLATVISRTGSAPRGAGAQMLIGRIGRVEGTIGGGFAEKQAEMHALHLLEAQEHDTRVYALHPAGDVGAICGGEVTVSFLYIPPKDSVWTETAKALLLAIDERKPVWLVLDMEGGAPQLIDDEKNLSAGGSRFFLPVQIGERAVIFGAGHCAKALCPVLASVGFRVTVYDNRPEYARKELFPQAEDVVCADFEHIGDHLALLPQDYAVVMTSGHDHDYTVLSQILRRPLAYAGAIGSRKKTAAVNDKLRAGGIAESAIASLHAPIGMAIMAATPEEIAVSVAGEMILTRARQREKEGRYEKGCPMH